MGIVVILPLLIIFSLSSSIYSHQFETNGTVLELDDSNFEAAISTFDYILVDFYAYWCHYSKDLAPKLDDAARVLAAVKSPIIVAKIETEHKEIFYSYGIKAVPTLKLFVHGVPSDLPPGLHEDLLVRISKEMIVRSFAGIHTQSAVL